MFVNNSQIQKYCCSAAVPSSDKDAIHRNIFSDFSTSKDTCTNQSANVNDIVHGHKPDYTTYVSNLDSPMFGRQKPSSGHSSITADYESRRTLSSTDAEDSDTNLPVITVPSRKRRRLHRRPVLIDSDSSDDQYCGGKVYKLSSYESENNKSPKNEVVANNGVQRLSDLKHRHCFDTLLNHERSNAATNVNIFHSLQKRFGDPLRGNDTLIDTVKCISQFPCESLDGKIVGTTDSVKGNSILSASNQCSVCLHKLQLCDIPARISLSQEDRHSLSGKCISTVSSEASTVNGDSTLSASADLIPFSEANVNNTSVLQSSDLHYYSNDDLFSDNEAVESVCLSPSHYCGLGEQQRETLCDTFQPLDKSLEAAVKNKPLEVTFVKYSQDEDDCILIDDSDDELFANLTQNDMTLKVEDDEEIHQSDDCEGFVSADDGDWTQDDIDCLTAAASTHSVAETPVTPEPCDPWINDVADVSSDELEEAYDAAMICAHQSKACHSVGTNSVAGSQKIYCNNDHDAVNIANMRRQCITSPCIVSLKRLRMIDVPLQICMSQEDKRTCEPDVIHDDYVSDDSDSDVLLESVESMSDEVNVDITCGDLRYGDNNNLTMSAGVFDKTEAAVTSTNLTETVDSEKLACDNMSAAFGTEADSSIFETVKDAVFDEWCQTSSDNGDSVNFNKDMSVHETGVVMKNVEIPDSYNKKRSTKPRVALENCVEVAEFYGIKVPLESRCHQRESEVIKVTTSVDKYTDTNHKNASACGLPHSKKVKSQLMMTAPHHLKPQKLDTAKLRHSSAHERQEWKRKSAVQNSSTASAIQYQKISQMRDCSKKKLRRDKMGAAAGVQNDNSHDQFHGLSQFSVAKQQLVERNRQLKANGLYFCYLFALLIIFKNLECAFTK